MTRKTQKRSRLDDRCYVVYGSKFNPMKVLGSKERDALMGRIRAKGLKPRVSQLSARPGTCKRKPTLYNRGKGVITIY